MRITAIKADELTAADRALWAKLQTADSALVSPYFNHQFTTLVAAVRDDTFVGVMEDGGATVGYFPFQRIEARLGKAVGERLSDYQGVIIRPGIEWRADELIRGCGLDRWQFFHLIASQEPFEPYHSGRLISPVIDLSVGFDGYVEERRASGSQIIKKVEAFKRKLAREVGPLRFEAHDARVAMLHQLVQCKSAQYRRYGYDDIFQWRWVVELLERIHAAQDDDFAGLLSVLYAGDRLVAAHMGMRSRTVWHYWFPCYNRMFACYSPGLVLLLEMIRCAPAIGLRVIDFGRGDNLYKQRFMNMAIPIAEGAVSLSSRASAATSFEGQLMRGGAR